MRLWSVHPKYLDAMGLVALWREGLLAKKVLEGATKGYRNHPQLIRFRDHPRPLDAISAYLHAVADEAGKRGYRFDATKLARRKQVSKIPVTRGQLAHEVAHLEAKLKQRQKEKYEELRKAKSVSAHPLFRIVAGKVEAWEKGPDSGIAFPYELDFSKVDFRKRPERYRVGKGEQGVLLVEPYKSEILPFWRFKTPEIAEASARKIFALFKEYKKRGDFVGMDMARKFLQMGYTRSRRYANHPSGRKYAKNPQDALRSKDEQKRRKQVLPQSQDWNTSEKAESARIYYSYYLKAREDKGYKKRREEWIERYG